MRSSNDKYIHINGKTIKDITGNKYGRLTAIRYDHSDKYNHSYWLFKCDCGREKVIAANTVTKKNAEVKSCGCLNNEVRLSGNNRRVHGKCASRLYHVWLSMRKRCHNKNDESYQKWYGAKGIDVCPEWNDYSNFEKWALENGYDETAEYMQCTIDRIDTNKNYSPDNCRWVSMAKQARNKSNNRDITWNGITHNVAEWEEITGIKSETIRSRIDHYGWTIEEALTLPTGSRLKKGGNKIEETE